MGTIRRDRFGEVIGAPNRPGRTSAPQHGPPPLPGKAAKIRRERIAAQASGDSIDSVRPPPLPDAKATPAARSDPALPLGWLVWSSGSRRGHFDVLRLGVNTIDRESGTGHGETGACEIVADDVSGALRIRPRDGDADVTVDGRSCVDERPLVDRARIAVDGEEAVLVILCERGFTW